MKKITLIFALCALNTFSIAANIVKAPGSTTDVFTEFTIQNILNADTLFIEGGFGDIYLIAGSADDGAPYYWDFGNNDSSTYEITFSYTDATETLTEGGKGTLISVSRSNPVQSQYLWVVYNDLPLKPSIPSGMSSVCSGTTSNYSSTSTNADSYEWFINPNEAGTLLNETTNTITVDWNVSWTGNATLSVRGIKESDFSPLSESLIVEVINIPNTPVIYGSNLVEINSNSTFHTFGSNANSWNWFINPTPANSTVNDDEITIEFTDTLLYTLTTQASNECGNSIISDGFEIKVIDLIGFSNEIDQIILDSTNQGINYRNKISELGNEIEIYLEQIDSLDLIIIDNENNITSLTDQVDILTIDNTELQTLSDNQILIIDSLQNSNDLLTDDNDFLQSEINLLTYINDSIQLIVDSQLTQIDDFIAEVETLTTENTNLQIQVDTLFTAYDNFQIQVEDLLAENAEYINQIEELNVSNEALLFQIDSLTPIVINYQEQIDLLTSDNAELQAQVESLTINNDNLQIEVENLSSDNEDLQEEIDNLNQSLISLQEQVDNLTDSNSTLQEQVEELTANNEALQVWVDDLITTNNVLQAKVEELEAEVELLSQVYILTWEVEEVTTHTFETEIGDFSISLYPNPNPGELFISCTEEILEVKIYNLQGQAIQQFEVNSTDASFIVNREEMPIGTYLVHIKTVKGNSIHRIAFQ